MFFTHALIFISNLHRPRFSEMETIRAKTSFSYFVFCVFRKSPSLKNKVGISRIKTPLQSQYYYFIVEILNFKDVLYSHLNLRPI